MTAPHNPQISITNLSQIKWACRRGMLELDLILTHFVDSCYATLTDEMKVSFINLLSESDPELFAWLLGKEAPASAEMLEIVTVIRQHALSKR
jgi:antitoxin CptB